MNWNFEFFFFALQLAMQPLAFVYGKATLTVRLKTFVNIGDKDWDGSSCDGWGDTHCENLFEICIKQFPPYPNSMSNCLYYRKGTSYVEANTVNFEISMTEIDTDIVDLVLGKVTLTLRLKRFVNTGSKGWDGSYCDGWGDTHCDNMFEICVKQFPPHPNSMSNCLYYRKGTSNVEANTVNFESNNTGIDKDIVMNIDGPYTGLGFFMKIMDYDSGSGDDHVDNHIFGEAFVPGYNGVVKSYSRMSWGQRSSYKSKLTFTVKASCHQYYYSNTCGVYCMPKDDSGGHYTCDSNGNRVCRSNWLLKPDCLVYCAPQDDNINGHYTCDSNGIQVCRANWHNAPSCKNFCKAHDDNVNGHYTCDVKGNHICRPHWYNLPNCTKYCEPKDDNINGHYGCDNNGTRVCHTNWHNTPSCNTFCQALDDNIKGHYTCDAMGNHICRVNWFNLPNCTKYCESKDDDRNGHYTCDRNGYHACRPQWCHLPNCTKICNKTDGTNSSGGTQAKDNGYVNVKVMLLEFRNPVGRLYNGNYCDHPAGPPMSSCQTYFKLCVTNSLTGMQRFTNCAYAKTSAYVHSHNINFQIDNTGIPKAISLRFRSYVGGISLYMEVWDDDSLSSDDLIDKFAYGRSIEPGVNGTNNVVSEAIYGMRNHYKTTLYFKVDVACDINYYGRNCQQYCINSERYRCNQTGDHICKHGWYNAPDCTNHCVPSDDDINEHFTCDKNGTHACRESWFGPPNCTSYCIPHDDDFSGHYTCDEDGKIVCRENWFGTPNCTDYCVPRDDNFNGHYVCGINGTHECSDNWFGANCTNFCVPNDDDINGHYTCNKNGTHICKDDWFGNPNCTNFCIRHNDDINGHYTCDKNGTHICRDNWFATPNCTNYCIPQNDNFNGHYTCDENGETVCRESWFGTPNCTISCIPRNDSNGHYICATNGSHMCVKNWYKAPNCTTYCSSKNISSGKGNLFCNDDGQLVCKDGWHNHGNETCSLYCMAQQSHLNGFYNCAKTGEKVCLKNWYGNNCTQLCDGTLTRYDQGVICKKGSTTRNMTIIWWTIGLSLFVITLFVVVLKVWKSKPSNKTVPVLRLNDVSRDISPYNKSGIAT